MTRPPDTFETGRLFLRKPRLSDAESVFKEYATDKDVTKYMTWKPHSEITQTETFLKSREDLWERETEFTWVITIKPEDSAIGMLSARNGGFKSDIGYVIAKKYWGQGLMSEAVQAFTQWALAQPDLFRIWAFCDSENPASARVLEKAGMVFEAEIGSWATHPNISDSPRNCLFYSITKN